MRGDAGAAASGVVAQAVISADDLVAFNVAEAERNSAVIADVARGVNGAAGEAIENYSFIEKADGYRLVRYLPRVGDGIPEDGEGAPIRFSEGTVAREGVQRGGNQF